MKGLKKIIVGLIFFILLVSLIQFVVKAIADASYWLLAGIIAFITWKVGKRLFG